MDRSRRFVRGCLALSMVLALGVSTPAVGVLPFTASVLMNEPGYDFHAPHMSMNYIVTERENDITGAADVVRYDRRTEAQHVVGYGDGFDQETPDAWGTRLVWIDHREADGEVWYDDTADVVAPRTITNDTNDDVGVRIDGNYIVWVDGITATRQIRFYDIERNRYGTVPGTNLPNGVSVDRERVCWYDDDKRPGYQGVYVYDLEKGFETVVVEISWATTTRIAPSSPSMHGNNVAWVQYQTATPDDKNIWAMNLPSAVTVQVTTNTATQANPAVFGDILAWQDDREGNEDVMCWWGPEVGPQYVAVSTDHESYPDVYGHSVVYERDVGAGALRAGLSVASLDARRIAGGSRYATAAMVSESRFPASKTAVIATGEGFPDALSAAALAGALECPLLLTRKTEVPAAALAELDRLGVVSVWIVGGTLVVTDDVRDQLEDLGMTVQRVAGTDRYETAELVAYWVMDIVNSWPEGRWRKTAFFVRGDAFPDALSIAPHAYRAKIPILLVRPGSVPSYTSDAITFCSITDGIIVGGTAAVNASTAAAIGDLLGDAAVRWDGADRYATAARCAREGVSRGWLDYDEIGVATGTNFPDALGGGAACGSHGSPLVLTAPTAVPSALSTFFLDRRFAFGGMAVYGGESAVNDPTFAQLNTYLQ